MEEDKEFFSTFFKFEDLKGVLVFAKEMKDEGNALFKKGSFDDVLEKYGFAGLVLGCFEFGEKNRYVFFELASCALLNIYAYLSKKNKNLGKLDLFVP